MKKNCLVWLLVALITLFVSVHQARATGGKKKSKRPNILFIMADDHASAAISCYDSWLKKVAPTPNLDRLAKQGVRFTNCVVTNSICTPSRAAMLTGQYSHKNGVYTLADKMDVTRRHLAHFLRDAGYQTAIIGKWHLGTDPQGFDYWNILVGGRPGAKGRPGQGRYYNPILRTKGGVNKVYEGFSTDVITDLSLQWLRNRDKKRPFFLKCHFKAPHRRWDPPPRIWARYKDLKIPEHATLMDTYKTLSNAAKNARLRIGESMNPPDLGLKSFPKGLKGLELRRWAYQIYLRRYLSCTSCVDENVGRLLDYLELAGISDDTLVIYTSDQGFFVGEHGWYDKRFMYEPCLTTPLIVRYPGRTKTNHVNDDMVLNIDYAPTMLDIAGVDIPKSIQGRSIRPLLGGETPKDWRTSMYYRYYMHLAHHWVPAHYGVRTNRYTLIYYYGDPLGTKGSIKKPTAPEWELFDRQKDPHQVRNVYNDPNYQSIVRDLKAEMKRLKAEAGDPQ